jgi:phage terminase large subunit
VLLPELMMWIERLPPILRSLLECFSDRVELKKAPASSFISAKTSTKERPQAMAGMHSDNMLIICDEASEIHDEVYEAISGSMAEEEARQILISNPTRLSGLFFRSHHGEAHLWTRFHVPSTDSKLVTPKWIAEQRDSLSANGFRRRVLGEFPTQEEDTLIAADLVEAAMERDIGVDPTALLIYGVDVARKGKDRTAIVKRRGNVVLECIAWHKDDLMPTVGRIVAEARKDRPAEICVDSIGVGGGVADRLREIVRESQGELKFVVRDVNVAETEAMDTRVSRLRDALWWRVKEWLERKSCKLPADEDLKADLVGPTYDYLSNGKIKIESKDDMRGRGLRSPDLGDALCLTFASLDAIVGGRGQSWGSGRGKPLRRGVAVA